MIDLFVHTIHYTNGITQNFDADKPVELKKGDFIVLNVGKDGSQSIINPDCVICAEIKHLTLTEEEYKKRQELLSNRV